MIYYEPPASINSEGELINDMLSAIIAILDAENALKDGNCSCSEETVKILSTLVERKRAKIKHLEAMIEKTSALWNRHKNTLDSLEQLHSEIKR